MAIFLPAAVIHINLTMKRALNLFILSSFKILFVFHKVTNKNKCGSPHIFPATGAIYDDLSDLQNHSPIAGLEKCKFSNSFTAARATSSDIVHRAVFLQCLSFLLVEITTSRD